MQGCLINFAKILPTVKEKTDTAGIGEVSASLEIFLRKLKLTEQFDGNI